MTHTQHAAIGEQERIGGKIAQPAIDSQRIVCPCPDQERIFSVAADGRAQSEIGQIDARPEHDVVCAAVVEQLIPPVARIDQIGIVPRAALQHIVACTTVQSIVARTAN